MAVKPSVGELSEKVAQTYVDLPCRGQTLRTQLFKGRPEKMYHGGSDLPSVIIMIRRYARE